MLGFEATGSFPKEVCSLLYDLLEFEEAAKLTFLLLSGPGQQWDFQLPSSKLFRFGLYRWQLC